MVDFNNRGGGDDDDSPQVFEVEGFLLVTGSDTGLESDGKIRSFEECQSMFDQLDSETQMRTFIVPYRGSILRDELVSVVLKFAQEKLARLNANVAAIQQQNELLKQQNQRLILERN